MICSVEREEAGKSEQGTTWHQKLPKINRYDTEKYSFPKQMSRPGGKPKTIASTTDENVGKRKK
jgi:hypothetical protein